jgi:hypothetical protein
MLSPQPEHDAMNTEPYDPDRSRAILFEALAKLVVWSQNRAPRSLLEEAERALAQAGATDPRLDLASAA